MKLTNQYTDNEEELSAASKGIMQLLINVLKCKTNQEDGIDHTYRFLTNKSVVSEEQLKYERLIEEARIEIMEEERKRREGLLDGEGLLVKQLVKNQEIDPPHQAKYLFNLLGQDIGVALENGGISLILMAIRLKRNYASPLNKKSWIHSIHFINRKIGSHIIITSLKKRTLSSEL